LAQTVSKTQKAAAAEMGQVAPTGGGEGDQKMAAVVPQKSADELA